MTRAKAKQLRQLIESIAIALDDETALTGVELFPSWAVGKAYAVSDRVQHNGALYKCVQAHTSQADWTPDATPALWAAVSVDEWPEWVQPTGAHDMYHAGEYIIWTDGKTYRCKSDTAYSPADYAEAWEETIK